MRITAVRTVVVWGPRRLAYGAATRTALGLAALSEHAIVFVDTDAVDRTGIGEISSVFKRRGRLLARDVEAALGPAVIGEDPRRIAYLGQKMDGALDGVEEAKAGIEMALWDILGKALRVPVYALLGGKVRDRIPLSYSVPFGEPQAMAEYAREDASARVIARSR
jgi:L-alanine-DL-glutamate epimerase-like enolase superfamily enzyme